METKANRSNRNQPWIPLYNRFQLGDFRMAEAQEETQLEPQHLDVYEHRIDPDKETNPEIKILVEQIMSKVKDPRDKDAVFSWYTDEPLGAFASRHDLTKANASVVRFRAVKKA